MEANYKVVKDGRVVHIGSKRDCRQFARNRNHENNTQDYIVEEVNDER